MLFWDTVYIF